MNFSKLTYLIISLNSAIDSGKYQTIDLEEVKTQVERENIFAWLEQTLGKDIDLSLYNAETRSEISKMLADGEVGWSGQDRRKFGVEKQGLCLLLAWVNELVQNRFREAR